MATETSPLESNKNNGETSNDCQSVTNLDRTRSQNVVHYPLNDVELDFRRYAHRPLGHRDILISRIAGEYMKPRRVKGKLYLQETSMASPFMEVKARNREFGLDLQVAGRMVLTRWNTELVSGYQSEDVDWRKDIHIAPWYHCRNRSAIEFQAFPILDEIIYGLLQRHFLEKDPALQPFLEWMERLSSLPPLDYSSGWKKDTIEHLRVLQPNLMMQHRLQIYSGGHPFSTHGQTKPVFLIEPYLVMLRSHSFFQHLYGSLHRVIKILRAGGDPRPSSHLPLHNITFLGRDRPRRWHSLPPSGTRCSVVWDERYILFPRRPLSEIDKLSRRRSLSRSHIRAMFRDRSPIVRDEDMAQSQGTGRPGNRCKNCTRPNHVTAKCFSNCGYCNSKAHKADTCPVKPINRCKCQPFPQFHTVSNCFVRCSRRCGSPYPPGHFKHKNAMLCSHRCCLCGLRGHNGRKCNLQKCRCGERHLTQDCRWKVECPAKSCDRYLCTEHCRECARTRNKELKEYFVGMTCPQCLQNGIPVTPKVESTP